MVLGVVLAERAAIGVGAAAAGAGAVGQPSGRARPGAARTGRGAARAAGCGRRRPARRRCGRRWRSSSSSSRRRCRPTSVMPYTFLVRRPLAGRPMPGPEGGELAARAPRSWGWRRRSTVWASTALTAPAFSSRARAGYSEPNETPERDADQLGELLLQLVAVEVLLVEEAEDGEVDHAVATHRYIESIYRPQPTRVAAELMRDGSHRATAARPPAAPPRRPTPDAVD